MIRWQCILVDFLANLSYKRRLFQVLGPYTFRIGDTSSFGAYTKGGISTQVKVPVEVDFASLREVLDNPVEHFLISDFGKFDDPPQLHLAFLVIGSFL